MSLILEALKKSEANRRLGQAPDLGTPIAHARSERSPLWAWIVIVLAISAGMWWWFGGGNAPAPTKSGATADASTRPVPDRQSVVAQSPAPPARPGVIKQQQMPGPDNWIMAQRKPGGMPNQGLNFQPFPNRAMPAAPATAAPPIAAAPPAAHPEPVAPATVQPAAPVPAAAPATPALGVAPKSDVPRYYDLPFATRKALPELNLSMHVYTADPKLRFVILDGTRMGEGDTSPDNVSVREIRPDGVVLEFQGQRFFYPRDGQ